MMSVTKHSWAAERAFTEIIEKKYKGQASHDALRAKPWIQSQWLSTDLLVCLLHLRVPVNDTLVQDFPEIARRTYFGMKSTKHFVGTKRISRRTFWQILCDRTSCQTIYTTIKDMKRDSTSTQRSKKHGQFRQQESYLEGEVVRATCGSGVDLHRSCLHGVTDADRGVDVSREHAALQGVGGII